MTEDTVVDTTIHQPPMMGSEVDVLHDEYARHVGHPDLSSAWPSTGWWERTRRSHDDNHGGADPAEQLMIVPANEASWDDLAAICGTTDYPGQCQRFKVLDWIWRESTQEERTAMLRQTACGNANAAATSGLVAYVDDVGARQVFEDAGFEEVTRPTVWRVVMRIDFKRSDGRG
jgi:hypothetical protein